MKRAIRLARESAMHGLVFGILRKDHTVDVERIRELVGLAEPLAVTFHRAFDECTDLRRSLEEVIATGAARILTSGAARSALEGASRVQELVQAARDRIIILPGAGISARNIAEVVAETRAREFHSGLSAALPYSSCDYRRFQSEVENLAKALAGLA